MKKLLAIIISVAMLLSCLGMNVFATETIEEPIVAETEVDASTTEITDEINNENIIDTSATETTDEPVININANETVTDPSETPDVEDENNDAENEPAEKPIPVEDGIDANIVYGDVTGDGKVSLFDSAYIFFSQVGILKLDEAQKIAADVNGDGVINTQDARTVAEISFKIINCAPVEETFWPEGTPIDLEYDENGVAKIFLFNKFKNMNVNELEAMLAGTAIIPEGSIKLDFEVGLKELGIYADILLKQIDTFKIASDIAHFKIIFKEGKLNVVFESLGAYISEIYLTDDEYEDFENEVNINIEELNESLAIMLTELASEDHLIRKTKVVYGGVNYICEEYKNLTSEGDIYKCYFSADGTLKRIEIYSNGVPQALLIIRSEKTSVPDSKFDVPFYYTKVKFEDIIDFFDSVLGEANVQTVLNAF